MLVLTRKSRESIVIGRPEDLEVVLEITILEIEGGRGRLGFEAEITLSRADFGLTWNAALETGGLLVGDEVKIDLQVQAVAQKYFSDDQLTVATLLLNTLEAADQHLQE